MTNYNIIYDRFTTSKELRSQSITILKMHEKVQIPKLLQKS